jgi:hypothetical protein
VHSLRIIRKYSGKTKGNCSKTGSFFVGKLKRFDNVPIYSYEKTKVAPGQGKENTSRA